MSKKLLTLFLTLCMCLSFVSTIMPIHSDAYAADFEYPVEAYIESFDRYVHDLYVNIRFDKLEKRCTMYAAIYTSMGYMRQIQQYTLQRGSSDITVILNEPNIAANDTVKFFFLDEQNLTKPVGKNLVYDPSYNKLSGVVVETSRYGSLSSDEIVFDIYETYGNEEWEDRNGNPLRDVAMHLAEGIDANDYFGVSSNIYVKKNALNQYEVVKIEPNAMSNVVSIDIEDIDGSATDDSQIVYFPTASSTKTERYRLDYSARFYYNYAPVSSISNIIDRYYYGYDVEITLIENDGDNSYDMVIAKQYSYDIVNEVEIERNRFSAMNATSYFSFDFEDEDIDVSMVDASGNDITLADFSKGDVVAYISSTGSTNCTSYTWIEIINLGNNTVTGMIDETTSDSVYIDGTEYISISDATLSLGDEGVFYLTKTGKIFYVDTTSVSNNYGYILNAALSSTSFTNAYQVKMLTKDNEIVIYTVRDGIKYDGVAYNEDGKTSWQNTVTIPLKNLDNNFKANVNARIVTYKLDSDGLIREINTVGSNQVEDRSEYIATVNKLGKALEDDTVVFNIDVTGADYAYATDVSSLIDENEYSYYVFRNANAEYDCVIITDGELNYTDDPVDEPTLTEEQYGYILNSALSSTGFGNAYQVKMLTQDNEIVIYTVRDGIVYDGVAYNEDGKKDGENTITIPLKNIGSAFKSNISSRLVKYKTDSNGFIAEINTPNNYYTGTDVYDEKAQSLNVALEADSSVFNIDVTGADYAYVTDISSLIDGNEYSYYVFKNADAGYDCVIITDGELNYADEPVDEPTLSEEQYGYILNSALSSTGFGNAYQVKMLTQDNEIVIYTVRDGIVYDGVAYNEDGKKDGENTITIPLKNIGSAFKSNISSRLVKYKTDSNGFIAEINTQNDYYTGTDVYNADTQSLDVLLEDDTVIFNVDVVSEKSVFAANINYLVNNSEYRYVAFRNADGKYDCVVLTDAGSSIDYSQSVAIVSDVTTTILDDGATNAKKVYYYTAGSAEVNTIIIADDIDISLPEGGSTFAQIVPGAFMMFSDNGEGIAFAYTVLAGANTSTSATSNAYFPYKEAIAEYVKGNSNSNGIIGGYIETWSSKNGNRILSIEALDNVVADSNGNLINGTTVEDIIITSDINAYTFHNRTASIINIIAGDWMGTTNIDIMDNGRATCFLAFTVDGEITDFFTFHTRKIASALTSSNLGGSNNEDITGDSAADPGASSDGEAWYDPECDSAADSEVSSDADSGADEGWDENVSSDGSGYPDYSYSDIIYVDTNIIESSHQYDNNEDETRIYTYDGYCEELSVTFSSDTETESEWDKIYIYDAYDNLIGVYSGTDLAGRTIYVSGDTVKIRLVTDGSVQNYGYWAEVIPQ